MDLILLRHPKVAVTGICYGRSDVPLGETAPDDIARAVLSTPRAMRLVTSPAPRCRALADGLARAQGLTVQVDPRLRELDFGAWEGRPWQDIPRHELDAWAEDPETRAPPGGETFGQLKARVSAALDACGPAIVVTHAGPIRALWTAHLALSFDDACRRKVPFATPIPLQRR